jgi:4-coumarate--CoA ligase
VSPANPAYTAEELLHQLQDSHAKAIITIPELLPIAIAAANKASIPKDRIILFKQPTEGYKHYTEIMSSNLAPPTTGRIDPDDLAFLAYSSGTTGLPKGVMLSHGNVVSNTLQGSAVEAKFLSWNEDKIPSFLPFYHI